MEGGNAPEPAEVEGADGVWTMFGGGVSFVTAAVAPSARACEELLRKLDGSRSTYSPATCVGFLRAWTC